MNAIEAEGMLYERMRQCAIAELGEGATEGEVKKLADRYYNDDERPYYRDETPDEIAAREAESRRYITEIEREGGFPW